MLGFLVAVGMFACFLLVHLFLVTAISRSRGWRLGLVALVLVPVAPFAGFRTARALSIAWLVALVAYGVSLSVL